MRITNKMITNTMMSNINKNKNNLSALDQQYSTGKKIQRPSDDPIIAVRALKLRTNLSELNQYLDKNIKDAFSWMDVTEGALTNINDILTNVNTSCVQGATDTLTVSDRTSIVKNLKEYKEQIYQEGNANYAGRYVFTGFKTDKSLIFNEDTTNLSYKVTEKLSGSNIEEISKVTGEYSISQYNATDPSLNDFSEAPNLIETHRLRLSYDNLDASDIALTYSEEDATNITTTVINATNTTVTVTDKATNAVVSTTTSSNNIVQKTSEDLDAYKPGTDEIYFISDTGELVLGDNVYENLRLKDNLAVTYQKSTFTEGDLRPEHYFDCKVTDTTKPELGEVSYTKAEQAIQYEINFNQSLTVNTQGSDAIQHDIGRDIDEIFEAVNDVITTEDKISEVEKLLESDSITTDQTTSLNQLLEQLNTELVLKNKIMQDKFEKGIAGTSEQQETLNVATADLGSRYTRLELTESRLTDQKVDFEELLSSNEDADVVDTYIKLSSAETIYNASLSAASKVVRNTLLDFL